MVIMHEETYGPIAPIQKIETVEEAIAQSNGTEFGLAAYVFTENVAKGMKLIENLDFGVVGWNEIGRASCRERVWISVVAETVYKIRHIEDEKGERIICGDV